MAARQRISWIVATVIAVTVAAGCGLGGHDDKSNVSSVAAAQPSDDPTPAPEETTPEAPPPPSVKPRPTPKKTVAKPKPTEEANNFQLPPCAHYDGKKVSIASAKSALTSAAAKTYWPIEAPKLKLTADLVKSMAWHESGWQSNIVNCDGGRGLMQVMPDTVSMINQRFVKTYDVKDYKQNAILGANYLAWLTKYYGEKYFKKNYDLSPARCTSHTKLCLLNMVISAYNAGFGTTEEAYLQKQPLPNPAYVDSVRSLMTHCFCDKY